MTTVPSVGEILVNRYLEPNNISQYRLAQAIGKPQAMVHNLINGKRGLSPEMANLLGKALGTGAEYWMDIDAKWQLSKVDDECDVEQLLDGGEESNDGIYMSGGYVYSSNKPNSRVLGRALDAVFKSASEVDVDERKMLLDSVNEYVMYGTIEVPLERDYIEYMEDMPVNATALFEQFLINVGEDSNEIKQLFHDKRIEAVAEIGKHDIDGFERPQNWRRAKKVNLKYVGELLCAASQLEQDERDEVFEHLFIYTHNDEITLPDSINARRVFNKFLVQCENYHGVIDALGMTPDEYFNENADWSRF